MAQSKGIEIIPFSHYIQQAKTIGILSGIAKPNERSEARQFK